MSIGRRHWFTAILLATALHALAAFWWFKSYETDGALAAGTDGLVVGVGLAGSYIDAAAKKAEPQPETEPEPEPEPKPKPKPKPKPRPEPVPESVPEPLTPARESIESQRETVETKQNSASNLSAQRATGTGERVETGGNPAARQSYLAKVMARIARQKRYPRAARRNGITGVVTVSFTVLADGTITSQLISHRSGENLLDQAALDMLRRASPLPRIPDDLGVKKLDLSLPVEFSLNKKKSLY